MVPTMEPVGQDGPNLELYLLGCFAALAAHGVAVHPGAEISPGIYSSFVIAARFKLMREALRKYYPEPFMKAGELETIPSQVRLYSVEPAVDQPLDPDGLYLPFNLVHYRWIRARNLTMSLLLFVDLWIHKSRPVCDSTWDCSRCRAGDDQLKQSGLLA